MEGRIKILEIYPKSEEIISFYPYFFIHLQTFIAKRWELPCFGYDILLPKSRLTTHKMEGKLKILGTNKKSEEIIQVSLIFWAFGNFNCDVVKRKRPCLIGVY